MNANANTETNKATLKDSCDYVFCHSRKDDLKKSLYQFKVTLYLERFHRFALLSGSLFRQEKTAVM